MPYDRRHRAERARCIFPVGPSLGLALGTGVAGELDIGALAARAEQAGFAALWLPADALAAAAAATRRLPIVAAIEVGLSVGTEPALPVPAELAGRLAFAIRFVDPPAPARACRKAGARVMGNVKAAAREVGAPLLIRGSCHESLEWIASHADGWVYDRARPDCVAALLGEWRRVAGDKPFAQALPEGPGLEPRVAALLAAGVDHVAVGLIGGTGRPDLWGLPFYSYR